MDLTDKENPYFRYVLWADGSKMISAEPKIAGKQMENVPLYTGQTKRHLWENERDPARHNYTFEVEHTQ